MGRIVELAGKTFGKLTAIAIIGESRGYKVWRCNCECGGVVDARSSALTCGNVKSCGCLSRKHGMSESKTYKVWLQLRAKCDLPKSKMYKNYGGKGITLRERWQEFRNFYADVGDRPEGMVFDRKEVNGNYEPDNWHWVSEDGNRNDGRLVYYTYEGQTKTMTEWAREIGVTRQVLWFRLNESKMSIAEAVEKGKVPVKENG